MGTKCLMPQHPKLGALEYADMPPYGFVPLPDNAKAEAGDMAYSCYRNQWFLVRPGQNIIGATPWELRGNHNILSVARRRLKPPTT